MGVLNMGSLEAALNKYERNPLEVAGFTSLLLDIGINDEKALWRMVKRFLQSAVVEIHPDKTGHELTPKQHELQDAFEIIKDFKNFRIALKELRTAHSHRRSEENELKREEQMRRERFAELEKRLSEGAQISKELEKRVDLYNQNVVGLLGMPATPISQLGFTRRSKFHTVSGIMQAKKLIVIRISMNVEDEMWNRDGRRYVQQRYGQILKNKSRMDRAELNSERMRFWGEFRTANLTSALSNELLNDAVRETSRSNLPIVSWGEHAAAEFHGFTKLGGLGGHSLTKRIQDEYPALLEQIKEEVGDFVTFRQKYEKALSRIRESLFRKKQIVSRLHLFPEIVPVVDGTIQGMGPRAPRQRILGSVLADEIEFIHPQRTKNTKDEFGLYLRYEDVARTCLPVLVSGGYLLDDPFTRTIKFDERLDSEHIRSMLMRAYQTHTYSFSVFRVIVGII